MDTVTMMAKVHLFVRLGGATISLGEYVYVYTAIVIPKTSSILRCFLLLIWRNEMSQTLTILSAYVRDVWCRKQQKELKVACAQACMVVAVHV
jgi:hypothetical protein